VTGHTTTLRDATRADFAVICDLNLAAVEHTSPMDEARLRALSDLSCYHKVACVGGEVVAFLLAMDNDAHYRNANFEWFAARYARFIYVDRVVVSSAHRGLSLASRLYEDLFRYAGSHDIPLVACEYNLVPPNEPSRLFHDKFGFSEQGSQWLDAGVKRVSLQVARSSAGERR
jgi:predicted GNAT superfamily acetyltransferase